MYTCKWVFVYVRVRVCVIQPAILKVVQHCSVCLRYYCCCYCLSFDGGQSNVQCNVYCLQLISQSLFIQILQFNAVVTFNSYRSMSSWLYNYLNNLLNYFY